MDKNVEKMKETLLSNSGQQGKIISELKVRK